MDEMTYESWRQTLALLVLLTMGKREIDEGRFRDADDVFKELDSEAP